MACRQRTFILSPWYVYILVVVGIALTYVVAYDRNVLPYDKLSLFGTFLHWLAYEHHTWMVIFWWFTFASHTAEAIIAWNLTRKAEMSCTDQLKWSIQTFMLGYFSLGPLRKMLKRMEKKG